VPALAAFPGRVGRLVAVESSMDAGLPCGDAQMHFDCGYDDRIVTFRSDGSGRRELTRRVTAGQDDRDHDPAWSAGGRRIAFVRGFRIAVMRADGTHGHFVGPSCCFDDVAWSPNGRWLLASADTAAVSQGEGLYRIRIDGGGVQRLTRGRDSDPTWSSRGSIAFVRTAGGGSSWIYVIQRPGGRPRRLVRGSYPDWSPHGVNLAFARSNGIHTVRGSGRRLRRVTKGEYDRGPAWSPSGKRIAFVRYPNIYVMQRNGRGLRKLSPSREPGLFWESPSWQPLG
jgi:Tol biopolymer transport system component